MTEQLDTDGNQPKSFPAEPEIPGSPLPQVAPPEPAPAPLRFYVSAHTDIGCIRTNNEDAYGYNEQARIYLVCDGMGGGPNGELGASIAVETIVREFAASGASGLSFAARLRYAIEAANTAVREFAQTPENKGMGSTAVAVALDGDQAIVANVGDSRAYLIANGQCSQLTVDHSYRNELIRSGQLCLSDAMNVDLQGMESVICRAVGVADNIEPEFFSVKMDQGSAILLATDGLTRYMLQDEILAVISKSSFDTACANLIEEAKRRGGADNITCLLLLAGASHP